MPHEVKKETIKDLLTIFSDLVVVKFKKNESYKMVKGRWCLPYKYAASVICYHIVMSYSQKYRANIELVKKHGKQKTFHTGGNSSCHTHI